MSIHRALLEQVFRSIAIHAAVGVIQRQGEIRGTLDDGSHRDRLAENIDQTAGRLVVRGDMALDCDNDG